MPRAWPALAKPSRAAVFRIGKILGGGLPRRITDPRAIAALVPLIEGLLDVSDAGDDDGVKLPFEGAIGRLAANVVVGINDGYDVFRARLANWERSPRVYSETIAGIVRAHFSKTDIDQAAARFAELADPFLGADHSAVLARAHLDREFRDICWSLIMVQDFEGVIVPENAPSMERFDEHIGRWIAAVGGHSTNASALLIFLERFADDFCASRIVSWMRELIAVTPSDHRQALWREHGWQVGILLLHLVTERPVEMCETQTHRDAAAIAEGLLTEGVAGAGELRDALERIHRQ